MVAQCGRAKLARAPVLAAASLRPVHYSRCRPCSSSYNANTTLIFLLFPLHCSPRRSAQRRRNTVWPIRARKCRRKCRRKCQRFFFNSRGSATAARVCITFSIATRGTLGKKTDCLVPCSLSTTLLSQVACKCCRQDRWCHDPAGLAALGYIWGAPRVFNHQHVQ